VLSQIEYADTAYVSDYYMTSSDSNNDLVTSQEKLKWVTPKISLSWEVENTDGKNFVVGSETTLQGTYTGPS
jgi:hypothetical protein